MNTSRKLSNIFLVGPLGAGKSTIGKAVADAFRMSYFDTDRVVAERTGVDLSWIFDVEGEAGFRVRETLVLEELVKQDRIVLATGGGSILLEQNRKLLKDNGTVIYLKTAISQQLKRTQHNKYNRPLLRCDDVKEKLIDLESIRRPLYEEIADVVFSTGRSNITIVAERIVRYLKKYGFVGDKK
ncbi:MAG: shikimate kinase AroK [Pseudomonadota bacterium]|nr:shikimate kinase AroK [Gammaproteobacteria bacterium]MBU1558545.1 shikimate kinase AroK [Gammaproteobacteria bacterium]MBU1628565.1 shikimate kinase AroK [Gammaproteobacteria bacterium]MBU1926517.1 shikimate kinase AroK [Gammaproteobacteria bacterium]